MGLVTEAQQLQEQKYKPIYDNLIPVSPTAFQFAKYTDMPVSEYTGIPNISIPLYTIKQDEFDFPISLSYHAGGIRVSQEASWVGLGWDLTFGSVIQTINDQDDFGTYQGAPNPKLLPDYFHNAIPGAFPFKLNSIITEDNGTEPFWTPTLPVNTIEPEYGFMVATNYYLPINGSVNRRVDFFDYEEYDSEPDIFRANFFGHSINFIRKFTNSYTQFVVLNKKGYKIERTGSSDVESWIITVPDGTKYFFAEKSVIKSSSISADYLGNSDVAPKISSRIWMLTKIESRMKESIEIVYSRISEKTQFPVFAQKRYSIISTPQQYIPLNSYINAGMLTIGFPSFFTNENLSNSYLYTHEEILTPQYINYKGGHVEFITSSRTDINGGVKLDQIKIVSDRKINEFNFSYSYFDASGVSSPGFTVTDNDLNKKRLKLQGITLQDNSSYTFQYNPTSLPRKNSFAQDYWGFYNGNLQNQSMVPNAARLNRADLFNNGDNHSASLEFTKAGILEKVIWPTGGNTQFVYELHEFDNYWVPDYSSTANVKSHGHGLRIREVVFSSIEGVVTKKTKYEYEGGKAILPKEMIRTFPFAQVQYQSCGEFGTASLLYASYSFTEVNGNGFYNSNPFGSISGVGYDKVNKTEVDNSAQTLGRIETYYHNNPDRAATSSNSTSYISVMLPVTKYYDNQKKSNGLIKEVKIYDRDNNLLKDETFTYNNYYSEVYYGARTYSYGFLLYSGCKQECNPGMFCPPGWFIINKHLIGYYPVFDFESLLTSNTSKTYANGQEHATTTSYFYDQYNQIASATVIANGANMISYYTRTPDASGSVRDNMMLANRLTDIWAVQKKYYPPNTYPGIIQSEYTSTYKNVNGRYVQDVATISENGPILGGNPKTISYDQYDTSGNLIQYTTSGISNSFIWDYQNQYPIAKVMNSTVGNVAYTSFEADGTGSWWYAPWKVRYDLAAPTGIKMYDMEGGMWRNDLNPALTYKLTLWSKEGLPGVNINHPGGTYTIPSNTEFKSIRTINGWTLYELPVSNAEGVGIWKWGHIARTFVDEVRLCPVDAQMVTYTYEPLIGMTSQCDANNMIQYFQYDPMNRLQYIKDEKRNMLKMYCYNYNGLPQECDGNGVGNDAMNQTFYRDCGSPYFPGVNYMQVPANMFLAATKTQANQLAQNYINYYGPLITNTNTQCGTAIYAKISYENYHSDITGQYADVIVRFYADEACTQPISVTNLTVNYIKSVYTVSTSMSVQTNYSVTASGDKYVIGFSVEMALGTEVYRSYFVTAGSGYTAK